MKLAKDRLGPEGVKELQKLARGINPPPVASGRPLAPEGHVPYDKKAALQALELFMKNHGDPEELKKKILELLKKSTH